MKVYCLKCKTQTETIDVRKVLVKNRMQLKGRCAICDSKKCQFVSKNINIKPAPYKNDEGNETTDSLSSSSVE